MSLIIDNVPNHEAVRYGDVFKTPTYTLPFKVAGRTGNEVIELMIGLVPEGDWDKWIYADYGFSIVRHSPWSLAIGYYKDHIGDSKPYYPGNSIISPKGDMIWSLGDLLIVINYLIPPHSAIGIYAKTEDLIPIANSLLDIFYVYMGKRGRKATLDLIRSNFIKYAKAA